MTTDDYVIAVLERANPVPDPAELHIISTADDLLRRFPPRQQGRVELIETAITPERNEQDRRGWVGAALAAAAVAAIVVGGVLVLGNRTVDPPPDVSDVGRAGQPSDADLATVADFVASYNAGAIDEVLALVAPDVIVTEAYGAAAPRPANLPYPNWDQRLAWNLAQGEILTEPECALAGVQPEVGVALDCTYTTLDALVQAVDGRPIPTRTRFTVAEGRITEIHQSYRSPDFLTLGGPFTSWVSEQHPEVTGALFSQWTSREEAIEHGGLRAEWARQWAAFLDDNGCSAGQTNCGDAVTNVGAGVENALLPTPTSGETQSTAVGDITWTLLEGDASTQPERVMYALGGEFFGIDNSGQHWRSSDGFEWTPTEPAIDGELNVVNIDDESWAVSYGGQGTEPVLVRWDGAAFVPVDLPVTEAPVVAGLASTGVQLTSPVALGDGVMIVRSTHFEVPWDDLVETPTAGFLSPVWNSTTETLQLRDRDSTIVAELAVEVVPGNPELLVFSEVDTREVVMSIEPVAGVDAADMLSLLLAGGVSVDEIVLLSAAGDEMSAAPWTASQGPQVTSTGDRLFVVAEVGLGAELRQDDRTWELWTSVDGRGWTPVALPSPAGSLIDHVGITAGPSGAVLTIVSRTSSDQPAEAWFTRDGTMWDPAPEGGSFSGLERANFGWFRHLFEEDQSIGVSVDGVAWQTIPLDIQEPRGSGNGSSGAYGDTIFVTMNEDSGERTMWVGRVG